MKIISIHSKCRVKLKGIHNNTIRKNRGKAFFDMCYLFSAAISKTIKSIGCICLCVFVNIDRQQKMTEIQDKDIQSKKIQNISKSIALFHIFKCSCSISHNVLSINLYFQSFYSFRISFVETYFYFKTYYSDLCKKC